MKSTIKNIAFIIVGVFMIKAAVSFSPDVSLSRTYNIFGPEIAPNMVTTILFDFRGYDTLGECVILVSGVLALSLLYGRGLVAGSPRPPSLGGAPGRGE